MSELRRGVLGPCALALLDLRPRFGLEIVRDLAAADGLLTSDGTPAARPAGPALLGRKPTRR